MSVRGQSIDIYESCPVSVLIFRFRQSVAFLKSRIRWEREYLPTSPLGQFPNNTAITTTTTTSWDSRGTFVLKVPSIHQSINQYSGYHLFKSLRSSRTRPDDKLTHTNEQTNRARKQTSKAAGTTSKKNEKQRSTGRPFISEYSYSTKPKPKKTPKSPKKKKPLPTNQPNNKNSSPIF